MTTRLTHRCRQIAKTLRRHGLGFAAGLAGMDWLIPFHRGALGHEVRAERYTTPEHVRLALEQLGPMFIKLGQLLSTRPDLLPADYIGELAKLQDSAPPVDIEAVRTEVVSRDRKWRPWEGGMMTAGLSVVGTLGAYLLWTGRRHRL